MHFIYQIHNYANNHESRFNLFGLLSQQCATYSICPVAGLERMTTGSVAKRLTLSRLLVYAVIILMFKHTHVQA